MLDGSLGRSGAVAGPNFDITADLGRQLGPNLFHSFSSFGIAAGETATFSGPADVARIISRVTGGAVSSIDGLLRSSITGADFFLINPAGVVFGPQAVVDVSGSFHVATAQQLRFADGSVFDAANPAASSLTIAEPEAFGFLGGQAGITMQGSRLVGGSGVRWTLAGSDILIADAELSSQGSAVQLRALEGAGEVRLDGTMPSAVPATGQIRVTGSRLSVDGGSQQASGSLRLNAARVELRDSAVSSSNASAAVGGAVSIGAGELVISDGATVSVDSTGAGRGGDLEVNAGHLQVTGVGSALRAAARSTGDGGDVRVQAGLIELQQDGSIGTNTMLANRLQRGGKGGSVSVAAQQIAMSGGGRIQAISSGTGDAGNLSVAVEHSLSAAGSNQGLPGVTRIEDSGLYTQTRSAHVRDAQGNIAFTAGRGGDLVVTSPDIVLDDNGVITASANGDGAGGSARVDTGRLVMTRGGHITARAFLDGAGGDLDVSASDSILIDGVSSRGTISGIQAGTRRSAAAGGISVRTPQLTIRNGGNIAADTAGAGAGGNISVDAGHLLISGTDSSIVATAAGSGDGGSIDVRAGLLEIEQNATISADTTLGAGTQPGGRGGSINIQAEDIRLSSGGRVTAITDGSGDGGNLSVTATRSLFATGTNRGVPGADKVEDSGAYAQTRPFSNAPFTPGDGGTLMISSPDLVLEDDAVITSSSSGAGDAGDVTITTDRMLLRSGGHIAARAFGAGSGGDLSITAGEEVLVSGLGQDFDSSIRADTRRDGRGGNVVIQAPRLRVEEGGFISAETAGSGAGGSISLHSDKIEVRSLGRITVDSRGVGNAGDLLASAGRSIVIDGGGIAGDTGLMAQANAAGQGGDIVIETADLLIDNSGLISAETKGGSDGSVQGGVGGSITVTVDRMLLDRGGQITANSEGSGDAGQLVVTARDSAQLRGSGIKGESGLYAATQFSGNGGDITVDAARLLINDDGVIAATTQGLDPAGVQGDGGAIAIHAGEMILAAGGHVTANSFGKGDAGTISVDAAKLLIQGGSPQFSSSVLAAATGEGRGGNIVITAPEITLADGGTVSARSSGSGEAGGIRLISNDSIRLLNGGDIDTQTTQSDGGNIDIQAERLVYLDHSRITTSVAGGAGNGGNISIDPRYVVLNASRIVANAFGGNGGNITIVADNFLRSVDSVVDASSKLGISGNITIDAPNVDIGAGLGVLPADFIDASRLLRQSCAAGSGQKINSFVAAGRGGLPESFQGPFYASTLGEFPAAPAASAGSAAVVATAASTMSPCAALSF